MKRLDRIRRYSAALHLVTLLSMGAIVLGVPVMLAFGAPSAAELAVTFKGLTLPDSLPIGIPVTVMALGFLPLLAVLVALWHMAALFRLFKTGETLSPASAQRIIWIGAGILSALVLNVMSYMLQVLALTSSNPPGQRALAIAFRSPDLALILAGGFLLVLGWVMGEAARIAEENRGFV